MERSGSRSLAPPLAGVLGQGFRVVEMMRSEKRTAVPVGAGTADVWPLMCWSVLE